MERKSNVAKMKWLGVPPGLSDVASYSKKAKLMLTWSFSQKRQAYDDAAGIGRPKCLRLPASTKNGNEDESQQSHRVCSAITAAIGSNGGSCNPPNKVSVRVRSMKSNSGQRHQSESVKIW